MGGSSFQIQDAAARQAEKAHFQVYGIARPTAFLV
jgi:hypothetical protein